MAITSPGFAVAGEAPSGKARLRAVFNFFPLQPLSNWSVKRVRLAIDQHEIGRFRDSALLSDHMERNPRIGAALQTRVLGVAGLPFKVEPGLGDRRRSKNVAAEFQELWPTIAPEASFVECLLRYVQMGVSIAEIVWTLTSGSWIPSLKPVHPGLTWYDRVAEHWWVMTSDGLEAVIEGDPKWFILKSLSTRPWMRGIVRCLGIEDKIRQEAVRDWSRWSERHGIPIIVAKIPSESSSTDRDTYFNSIKDLGAGGTTVMAPQGVDANQSYDIELVEAKDRGFQGFQSLLQLVADDASIAILGQNLTQETKGGSLAAAKVHDRVRADYLEADAKVLASAVLQQIAKPWARYNHGDESLAPLVSWDPSIPEDVVQTASTWSTAASSLPAWKAAGLNVDLVAFAKKIGLPLVAGKELVEPTVAPIETP